MFLGHRALLFVNARTYRSFAVLQHCIEPRGFFLAREAHYGCNALARMRHDGIEVDHAPDTLAGLR